MPTKSKRDPAKVKCFECGERGHYANACPNKEASNEALAEQENTAFHTWEDKARYVTYRVTLAMNP